MEKCGTQIILDEISDLLDTYNGRDKVLRTLCYATKLIGGLSDNPLFAERMKIFSSQMSGTRAVLRLLDDLPMLKTTLDYGLGNCENDGISASLGVATNIIDQLYYPIEKMAWFYEYKLINGNSGSKWDTASSVFWVASIYLTLLKNIRLIWLLEKRMGTNNLKRLDARKKFELLKCFKLTLDLVHAVNTLPKGIFWGEVLNTWQVGLVATTSSIIGLYQIFAKRAL